MCLCVAGWAGAEVPHEVPCQVRLVVEPDLESYLGGALPGQQQTSRAIDAATGQIDVRRQPERPGERADQVAWVSLKQLRCFAQGQATRRSRVQQVAQIFGEARSVPGFQGRVAAEMVVHPVTNEGETALGLECVRWMSQCHMQLVDTSAQQRILEVRLVDGGSYQLLAQHPRVEIQHALAEAVLRSRSAVMRHVRRQQGHRGARRTMSMLLEVEADRSVIDDQQRPRVMCVRWVGVVNVASVEHLGDAGYRGAPGADLATGHVKNVQDAPCPSAPVLRL